MELVDKISTFAGETVSLICPPGKAIFSGIQLLIKAVNNQKAYYDSIEDLFERFQNFLRVIHLQLKYKPVAEIREHAIKTLAQLLIITGLVTKLIQKGRFVGYLKGLIGIDSKLRDALKTLDRYEQQEPRLVQAATLGTVLELTEQWEIDIRGGANALLARFDELLAKVDGLTNQQKWDCITRWLSVARSENHGRALRLRHEGTGQWILENNAFKSWLGTPGSICWVCSGPGYGKTVLCSYIIEYLRECHETFAYFYFDFNKREEQTYNKLLSSLVLQFSDFPGSTAPPEPLTSLYTKSKARSEQPLASQLRQTLQTLCNFHSSAFILIDALDECPEQDRNETINFLRELADGAHSNPIRVLFTSRPESGIQSVMSSHSLVVMRKIDLQVEFSKVDRDVQRYVAHNLRTDPHLRKWAEKERRDITKRLTEGDHHMFRWVCLQLEALRCCNTNRKLREDLSKLPKTLEDTYHRILERIDGEYRQPTFQVLAWIMFANVPLTLEHLAVVFSVDPAQLTPNPEDLPLDPRVILSSCSGLLSGSSFNNTWRTLSSVTVALSHFSVRDYFKEKGAEYKFSEYSLSEEDGLRFVTEICLNVMIQQAKAFESLHNGEKQLLYYAATRGIGHVHQITCSGPEKINQIRKLKDMFDPKMHYFQNWMDLITLMVGNIDKLDLPFELRCNCENCIQLLPKMCHQLNPFRNDAGGGVCTPIHAAIVYGLTNIVEWLLKECSVDIHEKCENRSSAREVVNEDFDIDLHSPKDSFHGGPKAGHRPKRLKSLVEDLRRFFDAPYHDDATSLKALSRHPARVQSPLSVACIFGREDIVKLLLERGANINLKLGFTGHTALHEALSEKGTSQRIIEMLLENGADVNALDRTRGTPLHIACSSGFEGSARTLLRQGAKVNQMSVQLHTPLQVACGSKNLSQTSREAVVMLLLENGAKVVQMSKPDRLARVGNALLAACANSQCYNTPIIPALLERMSTEDVGTAYDLQLGPLQTTEVAHMLFNTPNLNPCGLNVISTLNEALLAVWDALTIPEFSLTVKDAFSDIAQRLVMRGADRTVLKGKYADTLSDYWEQKKHYAIQHLMRFAGENPFWIIERGQGTSSHLFEGPNAHSVNSPQIPLLYRMSNFCDLSFYTLDPLTGQTTRKWRTRNVDTALSVKTSRKAIRKATY